MKIGEGFGYSSGNFDEKKMFKMFDASKDIGEKDKEEGQMGSEEQGAHDLALIAKNSMLIKLN